MKKLLEGKVASPGVAEGRARVISGTFELAAFNEGEVLACLAKKSPLTAKEVWREASNGKFSYQAVHKVLVELESERVLERSPLGYSLRREWLSELSRDVAVMAASYEQGTIRFTASRHGLSASFHALTLLNKLLLNREMSLSRDEIRLFENRVGMDPLYFLVNLFDRLERKQPNLLYELQKDLGRHWYERVLARGYRKKPLEEQMRRGIDSLSMAGWGLTNFVQVDPARKSAECIVEHSPFASEYLELRGRSKKAVCFTLRGSLAGGWCVMLNDPTIETVETHCIAKGDAHCRFVSKPRKDFDLKDKQVRAQFR